MNESRYCSRLASDEPISGSADQVDVWLLLEYRPTWRGKALADNDLSPAIATWFSGLPEQIAALGMKARAQFIRQPELDVGEIRLMIGVDNALFAFSAPTYEGLMEIDVAELVARPQRMPASQISAPTYFVCTNGQRDLCCARFGLPVYQALRERFGERVWQTTHVGGHRFAPNVLVLPQAALYGRVTEAGLEGFLRDTEAGALHLPALRGRSSYPQPAQAAESYLLEHLGRDWSFSRIDEVEDGWDVSFSRGSDTALLRVAQRDQPEMILKSCADEQPQRVRSYLIESCGIRNLAST